MEEQIIDLYDEIERLEYEAFYIKPFEIEGEKIKWIKNIHQLWENVKKD